MMESSNVQLYMLIQTFNDIVYYSYTTKFNNWSYHSQALEVFEAEHRRTDKEGIWW